MRTNTVRTNYDEFIEVGSVDSQCSSVVTLRRHNDDGGANIEVFHAVGGSGDIYAGRITPTQSGKIGKAIRGAVSASESGAHSYHRKISGRIEVSYRRGDGILVTFSDEENGYVSFVPYGHCRGKPEGIKMAELFEHVAP